MSDTLNLIDEQITIALDAGPRGATGPAGPAAETITATVDMLTAADTTVYTVPADMLFRPRSLYLATKAITGSGTAGALSVLAAAVTLRASFTVTTPAALFTVKDMEFSDSSIQAVYAAGTIIKITVGTATTGYSAHTLTAILQGDLYDA